MSVRDLKTRNFPNWRTISGLRSPRQSPEDRRKIRPEAGGNLSRRSENVEFLKSSKPEPLWNAGGRVVADEEEGLLYRPQMCTETLSSPRASQPHSLRECLPVYNKDAKVVVNATVEGSPGPIRTLVKLGSTVEETIELVIKKYNEEGRVPHLDKNATAKHELHHSYFSLESLSKSDLIGDIGSRTFYLRRKCSRGSSDGCRAEGIATSASNLLSAPSLYFVQSFIGRKITGIIRRTQKLWKLFGCIP